MKQLLLLGGLLLAGGRCWGQTDVIATTDDYPEQFVGVWKVKARCVEEMVPDRRKGDSRLDDLAAQTWTISKEGDKYTLRSDDPTIGTIKGGNLFRGRMVFEKGNTGFGEPPMTNRIMLTTKNGQLAGSRLAGRTSGTQTACMWRYTIAGAQ